MTDKALSHRRTHNLLLIAKLLSQRDAASPFTLVLDSLEQPANPLVREYLRRANVAKTYTVFLGFETVRAPLGRDGVRVVDRFVPCWGKTPEEVARDVAGVLALSGSRRHHLLIIDSLHPLCALLQQPATNGRGETFNLTHFLSSLIAPQQQVNNNGGPTTSLVAVYHTDIPLPSSTPSQSYNPAPLSLLSYLATTILTTHSLATLLSANAAHARSLAPPTYGLDAGKEGVLVGLKPARFTRHLPLDQRGVVLELEHRRKSGRGVKEWYFLPTTASAAGTKEVVTVLDDHPLFRPVREESGGAEDLAGLTFELGLTDRQRLERDGVVLPYFDAQKDGGVVGPGEGGRILYDMGAEDDFDEEEDEI